MVSETSTGVGGVISWEAGGGDVVDEGDDGDDQDAADDDAAAADTRKPGNQQTAFQTDPFPARFEVTPFYALRTNPLPIGHVAGKHEGTNDQRARTSGYRAYSCPLLLCKSSHSVRGLVLSFSRVIVWLAVWC